MVMGIGFSSCQDSEFSRLSGWLLGINAGQPVLREPHALLLCLSFAPAAAPKMHLLLVLPDFPNYLSWHPAHDSKIRDISGHHCSGGDNYVSAQRNARQ